MESFIEILSQKTLCWVIFHTYEYNIILGGDKFKLADFGFARTVDNFSR